MVYGWVVRITFGWSEYAVVRNDDKTLICFLCCLFSAISRGAGCGGVGYEHCVEVLKNAYKFLNLRALKFSPVNEIYIFKCMGKIFYVEFQRFPLKFPLKKQNILPMHWMVWSFLCNIEILRALRFKTSYALLKRPQGLYPKISLSLGGTRFLFKVLQSFWNLTGDLLLVLASRLSIFKAIGVFFSKLHTITIIKLRKINRRFISHKTDHSMSKYGLTRPFHLWVAFGDRATVFGQHCFRKFWHINVE